MYLLKGGHNMDAFHKAFFLFPKYNVNWAYCPVIPLLILGLWDGVWEGIHTPEDVFRPSITLSAVHVLHVVPSKADRLIIQSKEKMGTGWAVSDNNEKAMNYDTTCHHLQYFSRCCGFPGVLPVPCIK